MRRANRQAPVAKTLAYGSIAVDTERHVVSLDGEAVTLTEATETPSLRADVLLGVAEVLRLGGRTGEAVAAAKSALELFEQKGNVVAANTAREVARSPET